MAYNENEFTKLGHLKTAVSRINNKKADRATTLAGYGITDAYTKEELDGKVSAVYKPGGSVAFADLPTADAAHAGYVYNVTDSFTTTANFVEGAGKKHPAGTNVVIAVTSAANVEPATYGYEVLAGFVDLSGLQPKEDGKVLSSNDYTTEEKAKLGGVAAGATKVEAGATAGSIKINGVETSVVPVASDGSVDEMLTEVLGPVAEA